jgi:hypothetical protein
MLIIDKFKSLIKKRRYTEKKEVIIVDKQCPHCISRGMLVFNFSPKRKPESETSNEKDH